MRKMQVVLTGNTMLKLENFSEKQIRRLLVDGHWVTIVAPADEYVEKIRALVFDFVPIQMHRNGVLQARGTDL